MDEWPEQARELRQAAMLPGPPLVPWRTCVLRTVEQLRRIQQALERAILAHLQEISAEAQGTGESGQNAPSADEDARRSSELVAAGGDSKGVKEDQARQKKSIEKVCIWI